MRGRVRHRRTGAPGDAVAQFTGREGTVFPGPWSRVQFDDGLECWCPDDELENELAAEGPMRPQAYDPDWEVVRVTVEVSVPAYVEDPEEFARGVVLMGIGAAYAVGYVTVDDVFRTEEDPE